MINAQTANNVNAQRNVCPNSIDQCKICFRITKCYDVFKFQHRGVSGPDLFHRFTGLKLKEDSWLLFCETCVFSLVKCIIFLEQCKKISKTYLKVSSEVKTSFPSITGMIVKASVVPYEPPRLVDIEGNDCKTVDARSTADDTSIGYISINDAKNDKINKISSDSTEKERKEVGKSEQGIKLNNITEEIKNSPINNFNKPGNTQYVKRYRGGRRRRDDYSLLCYICGAVTKTASNMHQHIKGHFHSHTCNICDKKLATKSSLKAHLTVHTDEKPYECDICKKRYKTRDSVAAHKTYIHSDDRPYKCIVCDKSFKRKYDIECHLMFHSKVTPFKCESCDKEFATEKLLRQHSKVHDQNAYKFCCQVCGKKFVRASLLKSHHSYVHLKHRPPIKKSVICKYCGKAFGNNNKLINHIRTHTGERPYKCDTCTRTFTMKSALMTHRRLHTNKNLFHCNFCEKKFVHNNLRVIHERIHTGERPFKCELCGKGYSTKARMQRHLSSCKN